MSCACNKRVKTAVTKTPTVNNVAITSTRKLNSGVRRKILRRGNPLA